MKLLPPVFTPTDTSLPCSTLVRSERSDPALATLRRFLHLCHSGEWLSERALPDRLRRRILLALRVHDALTHGTSIREIGILLFGKARVDAEWPDPGDSLKIGRATGRERVWQLV